LPPIDHYLVGDPTLAVKKQDPHLLLVKILEWHIHFGKKISDILSLA
jgi:hypothetical protein